MRENERTEPEITGKGAGKIVKTGKVKIWIVGLPSNSETGLNPEAREILASSEKIFCTGRFADMFTKDDVVRTKLVRFPDKLSDLPAAIIRTCSRSRSTAAAPHRVTVIATGDPDFYGITGFLAKHFPDAIERVLPAPSIMQECFARLALNWEDAGFYSIHGRNRDGLRAFLLKHRKGFLFTSDAADVQAVLGTVAGLGLRDYRIRLFEDLGTKKERMTEITCPYRIRKVISPLNALLYTRQNAPGGYIGIGLDESCYEARKGMITKREVRVNALSLLSLREGCVLWDIGAGSGSLSIEATHNPAGTLAFAIEKDRESFDNIGRNIHRHGAGNVVPVHGDFMKVHRTLPAPDRVFVGGGGGDWQRNLRTAWDRMVPGGVLVVSAVTVESLTNAVSFFVGNGIKYTLSAISAVRTVPVMKHTLLNSQNPVFLLRAVKSGRAASRSGMKS